MDNTAIGTKADYPRKQSRRDSYIKVKSTVPLKRQEMVKYHGWGYKDTEIFMKDGVGRCSGDRYPICNMDLPNIKEYIKEVYSITLRDDMKRTFIPPPKDHEYPRSKFTKQLVIGIESLGMHISIEGIDRFVHAQGQSVVELYRYSQRPVTMRIPDAVVWPTCHEEVEKLIKYADEEELVIIPYGGGSSVTEALVCPEHEERPIISVDLNQMNEILWIDPEGLMVCVEAGIIGQDLERELGKRGLTVGHEPDSVEFSTVGGWVSTRASGMKKNTYGNIEDLVIHIRTVTPIGVLEKGSIGPRVSSGPDFHQYILGSEGNLGIITEVCLKMQPLPEVKIYGSVVFPDFDIAVKCAKEIAKYHVEPTSLRVLDNDLFKFGKFLKPGISSMTQMKENMKVAYLEKIKGFNMNTICIMTIMYEGYKDEVHAKEKRVNEIIAKYKGIQTGAENGKRGYVMTFVIAYIRDFCQMEYNVICESLETSVEWSEVGAVVRAIRQRAQKETLALGCLQHQCMVRVAQVYLTGCCLYIYFSLVPPHGCSIPDAMYRVENGLREEIFKHGGTISHHHGVGKMRSKYYEDSVSRTGVELLKAVKKQVDPKNIFAVGNLHPDIAGPKKDTVKDMKSEKIEEIDAAKSKL